MYRIRHFKRTGIFIAYILLLAPVLSVQAADQARIHYITLPGSTIAVLLECNGKFGMVDSGEDTDYPDGTDPRYPFRPGIITGIGHEDEVISYLYSAGVTQDNFEFYIGTHPHSDHIGSADEIIRTFHPKRVYIQEYKDAYITQPENLWDNLYVYDHMLEAAAEVGATIIQNFSDDVPLYPEKVFIQGSVIWDDENDLDGLRPDHISLTLWGPDNEMLQELTVSPDDEGNWNYQTDQLQKYDDTKSPIAYQITMSDLDHYKTIPLDPTYSFLCSHIPTEKTQSDIPVTKSMETEEDNIILENDVKENMDEDFPENAGMPPAGESPETKTAALPDGGIFDVFSDACDNTGTSDNLFTDHIPLCDQVDAACTLDPNNVSSTRTAEFVAPAQTGAFEYLSNEQNTVSIPNFTLGNDMLIQIKHYRSNYKTIPKPDANYFSLGVLVECNGKSAFLSGDINNYEGTETALVNELKQVDILTLGHHGNYGSNTYGYVTGLTPQIIVCPGRCNAVPCYTEMNGTFSTIDALLFMAQKGTPLYPISWYRDYCSALIFCFDETLSNNIPSSVSNLLIIKGLDSENCLYYLDGFPTVHSGWVDFREHTYYFENSVYPERNRWLSLEGQQYYLNADATPATGWQFINSKWYYLSPGNGSMKTGWQFINNKWYYLSPGSGGMKTGWQFINNKWYYLSPGSGDMKTGWQFIKGNYYYLYPSGAMAADTRINGHYVNGSGKWIP